MVDIASTNVAPSQARWIAETVKRVQSSLACLLEKRRVYKRTLHELQTYSRRNLLDMGIDPDGLHELARRAAGL